MSDGKISLNIPEKTKRDFMVFRDKGIRDHIAKLFAWRDKSKHSNIIFQHGGTRER